MGSGSEEAALPTWDLTPAYPGFDSPKYLDAKQTLRGLVEELVAHLDRREGEGLPGWIAGFIDRYNDALDRFDDLYAFAYTQFSVDTRNETAQKEIGRLEELGLPLKEAAVRFRGALAAAESEASGSVEGAIESDRRLDEYRYFLHEALEVSKHEMTPAEEALAADLARAGGDAWGRLQEALSSTLTWPWEEGSGERKTVIELRSLAADPDRSVRERAYRRELEAWRSIETPMAFALNGVKGSSSILNERRGYPSSLSRSILQSRISERSLDALIGAMEESLPMFRRYFHAKARHLGLARLAFFDLFAPVGNENEKWPFPRAEELIVEQFGRFSEEMGSFASSAFASRWIDALPREGKVGGGYCIGFPLTKASRILCNYTGTFSDLTTVAHELGHAFHHEILKDASAIHRSYPMTLAETASIFAENIIYSKVLEEASEQEELVVLEEFLQGSAQIVVDILSRFYFERSLFERRREAELSPRELCDLMLDAQLRSYGDGLDDALLHPYMWAVKGHYYSPELAYYNFPYAFGLLFGLSLYALYEERGASFAETYRSLLAMTGRASAVEVTRSVGFDIETPDFWRSGLDVVRGRVERFCELAGGGRGAR